MMPVKCLWNPRIASEYQRVPEGSRLLNILIWPLKETLYFPDLSWPLIAQAAAGGGV